MIKAIWTFLSIGGAKVLLPFVAAMVTQATKAALTWKDLNGSARRIRVLEEATKRVEFWDLWLKTLSTMSSDAHEETRRAESELRIAADLVNEASGRSTRKNERSPEQFSEYKGELSSLRRFLMLYDEPSTKARGFRRFAYIMVPVFLWVGYYVGSVTWYYGTGADVAYRWMFHAVGLAGGVAQASYTWYQARTFFLKREGEYVSAVVEQK